MSRTVRIVLIPAWLDTPDCAQEVALPGELTFAANQLSNDVRRVCA